MRVVLLIITNLAITLVLGVVFAVLEASGVLPEGQWASLFIFSFIFGFGGAFISLLVSKPMAKWSLGVHVIERPSSQAEAWLVETVRQHASRAGVGMPEVGIYDSDDPNAFATGWSRDNSLVAVSTGLLNTMRPEQTAAVLGHEIAHVANGDMVTLTLLQGVLNTFVMFGARVIGMIVDSALSRGDSRDRRGGFGYFITVMIAQFVLGLGASMIIAWFSRRREFRADAGGAALTSPQYMAGALDALRRAGDETAMPEAMTAFGIRGGSIAKLFASHPPLEERIARLMSHRP